MILRTAVIASGESLSAAINDIDGGALVGIVMPAAWTAANLTLQASHNDTDFANVYDDAGNEVTITAAAGRYIRLTPADYFGANALKVRSGTSGTPVNQGAARTIIFVLASL